VPARVALKGKVDPKRLQKLFSDEKRSISVAVAEQAGSAGATHHHVAAGDGEVSGVDEWDKASSLQAFFDNPTIAGLTAEAGVEGPPEVNVYEIMDSPDRFQRTLPTGSLLPPAARLRRGLEASGPPRP
jgi:hypothetical protein